MASALLSFVGALVGAALSQLLLEKFQRRRRVEDAFVEWGGAAGALVDCALEYAFQGKQTTPDFIRLESARLRLLLCIPNQGECLLAVKKVHAKIGDLYSTNVHLGEIDVQERTELRKLDAAEKAAQMESVRDALDDALRCVRSYISGPFSG